jgi:hypothetical protein
LHDSAYFNDWLGRHLTAPLRYRQRHPSPFFLHPVSDASDGDAAHKRSEVSTDTLAPHVGQRRQQQQTADREAAEADIDFDPKSEQERGPEQFDADKDDEEDEEDEKDEEEEEEEEDIDTTLPFAVRSRHSVASTRIFADATEVLAAVLRDECALRRAEGLRVAYIKDALYIDGEVK